MKKLRCSKLEAIGMVVVLWAWGMQDNADERGKLVEAEEFDIEEVFNGLSKMSEEQIVQALIEAEWLDMEDGHIFIHDWAEYQKPWYKLQKKKSKDLERYYSNKDDPSDDEPDEGDPPKPPDEGGKKKTPKEVQYTKKFNLLWDQYPYKRGSKEAAFRQYVARYREGYTYEQLYAATVNYSNDVQRKGTKQSYVLHGSTFFGRDHHFKEYLPKEMLGIKEPVEENRNPFADDMEDE